MDAPAVAVNRDGSTIAVAWMDQRKGGNNRQVYWTLLDAKARKGEISLADDPKEMKGHPSLAVGEEGVHAAWEDLRSGVQRIHYRTWTGKDVALSPEKGKASFPSLACGKVVGVAFEYGDDAVFVAAPR